MADNEHNDIEDPSDADDLLYSTSYGTREFHSGSRGKEVIIGVILEETEDSFLVAMPVHIVNKEQTSTFTLEQLSYNEPFSRLMKNSFTYVSYPGLDHDMAYIDFLHKEAGNVFPELLEMIGEDSGDFVPAEEVGEEEPATTTTQISMPTGETLINGNFTAEELKKKIDDAIENGGLLNNGSTLAN